MAGVLKVRTVVKITGLGDTLEIDTDDITFENVPVEFQKGYTVIAGQTTALDLFDLVDHIALDKIIGVYVKAEVNDVYIKPNTAGTTTFASTAGTMILYEGEASWFPINATLAGGPLGFSVDGEASAAITWVVVGKA